MTGLKGWRGAIVGMAILLNVGVGSIESPISVPPPTALMAKEAFTPRIQCGDSISASVQAEPAADLDVEEAISIRAESSSTNPAVLGNGGQALDVPANRGAALRFYKWATRVAIIAVPVLGKAFWKVAAKALDMGLDFVTK